MMPSYILLLMAAAGIAAEPVMDQRVSGSFSFDLRGFRSLCESAHIACGLLIDDRRPFGSQRPPMEIENVSVLRAVEELIEASPGYRWTNDAGVILVSPDFVAPEAAYKLYSPGVNVLFDDVDSSVACHKVLAKVNLPYPAASNTMAPVYGRVTTQIENMSPISALNKVVRLDGQMMWVLQYKTGWFGVTYNFQTTSWRRKELKSGGRAKGAGQ